MSEPTMTFVGGPRCGKTEPVEAGWPAPHVIMHRDIPGVRYVRRGESMTYDCKEDK